MIIVSHGTILKKPFIVAFIGWLIIVFLIFRLIEVVLRKRNCIPRGLEGSVLRRWQTQLLLLIFLLTTASGAPIWQEPKKDESNERQVGEIEKELGCLRL